MIPAVNTVAIDYGIAKVLSSKTVLQSSTNPSNLPKSTTIPSDGIHFKFDNTNDLLKILDGAGVEWGRFNLGSQDLVLAESLANYTWDTDALAYFTAVETAGGSFDLTGIDAAYTSTFIKVAHSEFYKGLKADGLWDKLTEFYLLAGKTFDGLTVKGKGTGSLANSGFVAGDWNAAGSGAGLTGDGSTKYLDTGLLLSDTTGSMGFYGSTVIDSKNIMGAHTTSSTNRTSMDSFGTAGAVRSYYSGASSTSIASSTGGEGHYISSRRGVADFECYKNGATQATRTATDTLTPVNLAAYLFTVNVGGVATNTGAHTLTFAHLGTGLTDTEASNLSTRVNTLMTALGCNVYAGSYTDPTTSRPTSLGVNLSSPSDTPAHTLEVNGSFGVAQETLTADTTLDDTHSTVLVDASAGAVTVTLPAASTCSGRIYTIKNIDSTNTLTVDADGTETIDGELTKVIPYLNSMRIQSDGSNWWIL